MAMTQRLGAGWTPRAFTLKQVGDARYPPSQTMSAGLNAAKQLTSAFSSRTVASMSSLRAGKGMPHHRRASVGRDQSRGCDACCQLSAAI